MVRTCELLYGPERAAELQAFLEEATGAPCPVWSSPPQLDDVAPLPRPAKRHAWAPLPLLSWAVLYGSVFSCTAA